MHHGVVYLKKPSKMAPQGNGERVQRKISSLLSEMDQPVTSVLPK